MSTEGLAYVTKLIELYGFHENTLGIIQHAISAMEEESRRKSFLNPQRTADLISMYEFHYLDTEVQIIRGVFNSKALPASMDKEYIRRVATEGQEPIALVLSVKGVPERVVKLFFV